MGTDLNKDLWSCREAQLLRNAPKVIQDLAAVIIPAEILKTADYCCILSWNVPHCLDKFLYGHLSCFPLMYRKSRYSSSGKQSQWH